MIKAKLTNHTWTNEKGEIKTGMVAKIEDSGLFIFISNIGQKTLDLKNIKLGDEVEISPIAVSGRDGVVFMYNFVVKETGDKRRANDNEIEYIKTLINTKVKG